MKGEDRDDPEETARRATATRPTAGGKFATVTADMVRVASKIGFEARRWARARGVLRNTRGTPEPLAGTLPCSNDTLVY